MIAKLCVGLICGGRSPEHEISLKSALYISHFLDKYRFNLIVIWINKQGSWFVVKNCKSRSLFFDIDDQYKYIPILMQQNVNSLSVCINGKYNLLKIDVIFPITHGILGEDGALQGLLRIMNLPYVGSDVLGSAICMDKDITKRLLRDSGLSVVPHKTFFESERKDIKFINCVSIFGLPFFVKPVNQGSSIGISKVDSDQDFLRALDIAFFYSHKIIIEPCIIGREIECAVLGNDNPQVSVCGEIISNNDFYTYYDKYIYNHTKIVIPAILNKKIISKMQWKAIYAFRILNCSDMARVDFFLTSYNKILINEINTLPGFTNNSMYPKLWEFSGLKPKYLLTRIIELAIIRYHKNKKSA